MLMTAVGGVCFSQQKDVSMQGVSIDTRTIESGDCFFCIRGNKSDGHTFISDAYAKQASAVVVDQVFIDAVVKNDDTLRARLLNFPNIIVVSDTVQALGNLARAVRSHHKALAVGITGSCGKTTTKELTTEILKTKECVHYSKGNYNNHLGLPLTLSKLKDEHTVIVSEMGASNVGDIQYLSNILQPDIGVVTNVHPVHLEGFGSLENIYKAKLEIAEYLDVKNGTLIIFGDDEKLIEYASDYNVNMITFGRGKENDFVLTDTRYVDRSVLFEVNGRYRFRLNTIAEYNVYNALAAIAVADYFKMDLRLLAPVFENFKQLSGRLNIFEGDILLIDDSYNANPYSFYQVLDLFRKIKAKKRKVVVCGDMRELGHDSVLYHEKLGRDIASSNADIVVGVGSDIYHTIQIVQNQFSSIDAKYFSNNEDAFLFLSEELIPGDCVLVKASRGIKLDEIVKGLLTRFDLKPSIHSVSK